MIEIENLKPFQKFCYTIGMIPTSYKESLTYEEQLIWFCDFLQNTVIPTVNNNGQAVTELQNLYVELKSYVDNYFSDLDIQTEINEKLDTMAEDGTLSSIINTELLGDLNNKVLQNSENIGTLNQELENKVSQNEANSVTMEMLTQDVREAMTGGSVAVVGENSVDTENIVDKAVNIYKLSDELQGNYAKEYENVSLGNATQGKYVYDNSGTIAEGTNANLSYYIVPLTKGTLYQFVGLNWYIASGILIVDSTDDSIVYKSSISDTEVKFTNSNLEFSANKNGLLAYINLYADVGNNTSIQNIVTLTKITNITYNYKEKELNLIKTITGNAIWNQTDPTVTNLIYFGANQYANVKMYKLSKGTKYKVTAYNIYDYCGLVLTDINGLVTYKSSSSNIGGTKQLVQYNFEATNDGFAFLMDMNFNAIVFESTIEIDEVNQKYSNITWSLIGDSLTDSASNPNVKKYYSYIQDDLGIQIQNLGQSGCGYKKKYNNGNNFVEQSLLVSSNANVVTIFGSLNDSSEFSNLGTVDDTTTDTVLGCVYNTINNLITTRPNAKIGIILPTPWNSSNPLNMSSQLNNYIEGIKTIAKKYSIPVLDLFYESNMFPWNDNFKTMFFVNSDGVHPNTEGNKRFTYKIEEFIKTLV